MIIQIQGTALIILLVLWLVVSFDKELGFKPSENFKIVTLCILALSFMTAIVTTLLRIWP